MVMGDMTTKSTKSSRRVSATNLDQRPLRVRIVIAGDEGVGKSCIIKRYCEKRFISKYLPTIGIDYGATKIYVDKKQVSVHIFDTSGQTLFQEVRNEFYREAHGILLVMDVTRRSSFDSLNDLINEIRSELILEGKSLDNVVFFLAANKSDLDPSRREVDELEVRLWAELYGFPCHATSATTGSGITDMFQAFFSQILKLAESGQGNKTPRQGKRQISTVRHSRERSASTPLQQPTEEQVAVMVRLSENIDPWIQLGLEKGAKKEEVNRSYRKLAMLLHPDKTQAVGTSEAFKLLGQARNIILKNIKN